MTPTRISPHAHQLTFLQLCNCYLVREEDGFTLIDTTISGRAKAIVELAKHLGAPIQRLLLTHAHSDHTGSLDTLHDLLGNVSVAIGEREAPLLHKDLSLRPGEPQQKPKGSYAGAKTRPTHTLTEGELFGSLRCIATPGHTPGHMSFLDERDGVLYAGDALCSMGGLGAVSKPAAWWFPLPRLATWDIPLSNASARKLLPFQPSGIATGHGPFVPNGTAELEKALARL